MEGLAFPECKAVLREMSADLDWLLQHEPVDSRDLRLIGNSGHLPSCFEGPETSKAD
jgi:hypothetical protein